MTPIFSSPAAGIPYSIRRQSKMSASQKLPTIIEGSPLILEKKKESISEIFFSCFPYCKKIQS